MAVRLAKRRNEELVSGNHIVLHNFMNFQGRAENVVELAEKYDMGSTDSFEKWYESRNCFRDIIVKRVWEINYKF